MRTEPDAVIELILLPSEQGGRASAIPAGRLGCILVVGARNYDVRLRLDTPMRPGSSGQVGVDFLDRVSAARELRAGVACQLREARVIGTGQVRELRMEPAVA